MKKHTYLLMLLLVILVNTNVFAQNPPRHKQPRFNPREYKERMEKFVSKHAEFTQEEASKFFPIFHEMKEKQREIMKQIQQKKFSKPASGASDKEFQDVIMDIEKLKIQQAELEESYYKKMCKVVPAKKVFEAMIAEDLFHRNMLQGFDNHHSKDRPSKRSEAHPHGPHKAFTPVA